MSYVCLCVFYLRSTLDFRQTAGSEVAGESLPGAAALSEQRGRQRAQTQQGEHNHHFTAHLHPAFVRCITVYKNKQTKKKV